MFIDSVINDQNPSISYQDKLTSKDAATYIGVSATTLNIWRSKKKFQIPYYKVGSRVYYTKNDLNEFMRRQRQSG